MARYHCTNNLQATHIHAVDDPKGARRLCRRCGINLTRGATSTHCPDCQPYKRKAAA